MVLRAKVQQLKNAIVPAGLRLRRLPLGIGRGLLVPVDFRHQTKLWLGLYEVELNRHLRRLCPPGASAFDVGGQFGYDAVVLARLGGGPVVSFECDPALCRTIEEAAAANGLPVRVVEGFVSDRTDSAAGTVALDDVAFAPGGFVPDFVKLDIEGAEGAALRGARRLLDERRPSLLVETHGAEVERECVDLLRAHGYDPKLVRPRRWLPDLRPGEHNRWIVAPGRMYE